MRSYFFALIALFSTFFHPLKAVSETTEIPNELIDADGFLLDVNEAQKLRKSRRVTEDDFLKMAEDQNTIILDARSPERFKQLHIKGARHLNFTDFTAENLAKVVPQKDTRILIYCNNNVANSPVAFATKALSAALNLSTYTSLFTYGYRNVYELGPVVNPATSKIKFVGTLSKS